MSQAKESPARYARVKIEGSKHLVTIPVSYNKPEIPEAVQQKWQKLIDLTAEIIGVPGGLINRFTSENLEVVVASSSDENPYTNEAYDTLGIGMFCESVVGKKQPVIVENTEDSDFWRNNPHAEFGMKSYLGVPLEWQDGQLFGTLCVLDNKANPYSQTFVKLVNQFKELIETDLQNILLIEELKKRVSYQEIRLRDVHHRLKNQFNTLISYISLRLMDDADRPMDELLNDITHRIEVMVSLHDEVCRSTDLDVPALDTYIPMLCRAQIKGYSDIAPELVFSIEPLQLSMQNTVTLGLIVSELVSNSLKHAFSGVRDKKIEISLQRTDDGLISLTYRDNGHGLPDGFDPARVTSTGMTLIRGFTAQLNGTMTMKSGAGEPISFTFEL
ncbi:GAF domain-containing protein [Balneolales bacterium ANBcel1]|nr:GAF domain-containing protein [Balneolales bacterium ANBcel1]